MTRSPWFYRSRSGRRYGSFGMYRSPWVASIFGPWDRYAVVCLVLSVLGFVLAGFLG